LDGCNSGDKAVLDLKRAIDGWMHAYRLSAPWVAATALYTMGYWRMDSKGSERWVWLIPGARTGFTNEATEKIEVPLPTPYDLVWQSASTLRDKYVKAFERLLDRWIPEVEREARERGLTLTQPGGAEDHPRWLVRRYVCRDPILQIADDADRNRATVKEAIARLAAYLDLPELPPDDPGRPRGSKTKKRVHY
jgi:hypothetical protein